MDIRPDDICPIESEQPIANKLSSSGNHGHHGFPHHWTIQVLDKRLCNGRLGVVWALH